MGQELNNVLELIDSTRGQNFELLENQSSRLKALDSLPEDGHYEVQKLREGFQSHRASIEEEVLELKAIAAKIQPEVEALLRWKGAFS